MKLYHIKPLMEELSLDIESDLRVLEKIRESKTFENTDERKIVDAMYGLSVAIAELRLIYDQQDKIDLKQVRKARHDWDEIHEQLIMAKANPTELLKNSREVAKLRTTAYQIEAGLAIEEYRAGAAGQKDANLLEIARYKCRAAIAGDADAIMAWIYDGLISSLQISSLREKPMDPGDRIKKIESRKSEGEVSYRRALIAGSKKNAVAELNVSALNNLSYLMVKTSDAYAEAAEQPECQDQQEEFLQEAAKLLDLAREEIKRAETKSVSIDPIVLTTHADIEILNLRFKTPETDEEKGVVYNDIRGLLRAAVENGYSGYQGSQEQFFAKRPHFHNLAKLNADYQRDVCKDVGIPYDSEIAMPTSSPRD